MVMRPYACCIAGGLSRALVKNGWSLKVHAMKLRTPPEASVAPSGNRQ
jgi:hypothetical protein